ncbi:MAG: zinc-ribbon domain-containing protein [Candidatus Methanomethylophilaceae archaeon]|nr:zinc-ribbon domain-containing protein [Candidatus Methanomethylophilaceae archaeon]
MSDEERRFCVACGALLPPGAEFCPECRHPVNGGPREPYSDGFSRPVPSKDDLGWVVTMILLYSIVAVLGGLMFMLTYAALTPEMIDQVVEMIPEVNVEDIDSIKNLCLAVGVVFLISGALAFIAEYTTRRRTNANLAIASCALSSVSVFGIISADVATLGVVSDVLLCIVLCVVGLFMTYKIYSNRLAFDS